MTVYGRNIGGVSREKRKPDKFRRGLKKISFALIVLGCVAFAVSLVFLWASHFQQGTLDDRGQRMMLAAVFGAGGGVSLLLYLLSLWVRHVYARRKGNSRRTFSNAGSVLLWVLILVGLAAGILFGLQAGSRALSQSARGSEEFEQLRMAAAETAMKLMRTLGSDPDLLTDHLQESWAEPVSIEHPSGIRIKGAVVDAQSYFDINNLTATRPMNAADMAELILSDIMRECGLSYPAKPLESLRDWVDEDGVGAYESSFYLAKRDPYRPPDAEIESLRELDWIEGWSLEMFTAQRDEHGPRLSDVLTVLPVHRNEPIPVNINTASPDLLTAIFGGDNVQLVSLLVSMRSSTPLRSVAMIEGVIGSERMQGLRPFLDVKSGYFRVLVSAERDGRSFVLNALAHRDAGGEVSVIRWSY